MLRPSLGLEKVPVRGKDLKERGSQASLSVFLALLILAAFVLPSMGLAETTSDFISLLLFRYRLFPVFQSLGDGGRCLFYR
jgi:hypothetical protein